MTRKHNLSPIGERHVLSCHTFDFVAYGQTLAHTGTVLAGVREAVEGRERETMSRVEKRGGGSVECRVGER
eukprot:2167456-Rhodomonas_salina.1